MYLQNLQTVLECLWRMELENGGTFTLNQFHSIMYSMFGNRSVLYYDIKDILDRFVLDGSYTGFSRLVNISFNGLTGVYTVWWES